MAIRGIEVEVLTEGIEAQQKSRGSFGQNTYRKDRMLGVRAGFGQLAQYDTTFSRNLAGANTEWGYREHLGSYVMRTNFGHRQIVSVFWATVNTGNYPDRSKQTDLYLVSIYDETTGDRWEEPLYSRTSEGNEGVTPLPVRYGTYETAIDRDSQAWLGVTSPKSFYFEEYADFLFFGNPDTGMMVYVPATFSTRTFDRMVTGVEKYSWSQKPESESAVLIRAMPTDGEFSEGFAYLTDTEFPNPSAIASVKGRMAFAVDRTIFFSDLDRPTSIVDANFIQVPSEEDITALAEHNGTLLIWTPNETWVYRLNEGTVVSAGRLQKLSDHIGCVSPTAWARVKSTIAWVDTNGVFLTTGDYQITEVSEPIRPFFQSFMPNPLSSYFINTGHTDLTTAQPNSSYTFAPTAVSVAYSPYMNAVYVTVPEENISLCWSEETNSWSVWAYESTAYVVGNTSLVGTVQNITNPWVLADQDDLFLIGSTDSQALTDEAQSAGTTDLDDDTTARSYYLLQYGRGGALDRSVSDEDYRLIMGKYKRDEVANVTSDTNVYFIDRWIKIENGFAFSGGQTANAHTYFLPISAVIPDTLADGVDKYTLRFRFDNTKWEPVFNGGGSTEIDFYLPPKRIASVLGYGPGAPTAAAEVQCYDSGTGLPSATGDEIRIRWDGNLAGIPGGTWTHQPYMNLQWEKKEPLIFIPMRLRNTIITGTYDLSAMGISPITATVEDVGRATSQNMSMCWWEQYTTSSLRSDDSVAQPVDWLYKTDAVGPDDGVTYKARGIWLRLMSHGSADAADRLYPDWIYGPLNFTMAPDYKAWNGQIIDHTGTPASITEIQDAYTLRTRVRDFNQLLRYKVFDNNLQYGNPGQSGQGNLLIDDEEINELSLRLSTKGQSFSLMIFGFMQDKAEAIQVESIKAVLRAVGGRRRKGKNITAKSQPEAP